MKTSQIVVGTVFALVFTSVAQALSTDEQLGKELFFDANLSTPPGQSCAACHAPETGFTGVLTRRSISALLFILAPFMSGSATASHPPQPNAAIARLCASMKKRNYG